jgi:transcription elongation GreA/GreB family factor
MDKIKLIQMIREQLESDLLKAREAARATFEAATHEESKPENEYDTRGLEASYLAGAQAKRIAEIEELLTIYKFVETKNFSLSDSISATAVVEVDNDGKHSWLFLMSKGGGLTVHFGDKNIQVVTPNSPLGEALLGLKVGDFAVVESGAGTREYEVLSLV